MAAVVVFVADGSAVVSMLPLVLCVRTMGCCHADWSELKPGLGPHDVAYMLISSPSDDRPSRDRMLLRRYWEGLVAAGVSDYAWDSCEWCVYLACIAELEKASLDNA